VKNASSRTARTCDKCPPMSNSCRCTLAQKLIHYSPQMMSAPMIPGYEHRLSLISHRLSHTSETDGGTKNDELSQTSNIANHGYS
jgi:hypothetical protein